MFLSASAFNYLRLALLPKVTRAGVFFVPYELCLMNVYMKLAV